jgi:hypothetical protein
MEASYLSTITFGTNSIEERENINKLLDRQEDEKTMLDYLDFTGKSSGILVQETANKEYFHFVNSSLYATAEVKTDVTVGSAGDPMDIVCLASAGVKPRVKDLVLFSNGVRGFVSAISAATDYVLTVKPVNSADIVPAQTDGDKLVFTAAAYGEGQGISQENNDTAMIKRSNSLGVYKTFITETDFMAGTKIVMEFDGKNYYFIKAQHEALMKHRMDICWEFLYGRRSVGLTDADGKAIYATEGLRNSILNNGGINHTVATPGTFVRADLKAVSRLMDASRTPKEGMLWAGADYDNEVDDAFSDDGAFSSGGISYGSYNGKKEIALAMGVKSVAMYGRTWHKSRFEALEHSQVSDADGFTFAKEAYFIPAGKMKTQQGGGSIDRLRARHFKYHTGKDSLYIETLTGGLAPNPTKNDQVLEIAYSSTVGLEVVGADHFAKLSL